MNDGFIYGDQIFVIIGLSLLSFWMIRWYLWGIKTYPLNNSAQKKKGRNHSGVVPVYKVPGGNS